MSAADLTPRIRLADNLVGTQTSAIDATDPGRKPMFRWNSKKRRTEAGFAKEIASHLALETDDLESEGYCRAEAARRARVNFSNPVLVQERFYLQGRFQALNHLTRDLHFALRQLRRSPGFALTAILALALGLGANTAIFSLLNALLLHPLPVPNAEELTLLSISRSDWAGPSGTFSAPALRALEHHHAAFANIASFNHVPLQIHVGSANETVSGLLVSGQFFDLMRTPPLLGRNLSPSDDRAGNPNGFVVVLSETFWQKCFNSAANVVGRSLTIDNTPFTVVGVMPGTFIGVDPTQHPDIYVPLSAEPIIDAPYNMLAAGDDFWALPVIARRAPGVSLDQANASLRATSNALLDEAVSDAARVQQLRAHHFQISAESGSTGYTDLRRQFQKPLMIVFALCAAMLLLACINLASLFMARASARERELATRLAIGASRKRLLQQLLVESTLITFLGAAVGLFASPFVSHGLSRVLAGEAQGTVIDTSIDLPVFAFSALLAAMLIGILPALRATSGDLNEHLKLGANARLQTVPRNILSRLLICSEVALALTLIVGAGLLATSLARLYGTGLGFDPNGLISMSLDRDKQPLSGPSLQNWYRRFGEALSHLPDVESASFESMTPLAGSYQIGYFHSSFNDTGVMVDRNIVAPNYFNTMHIPMMQGRDYHWSDSSIKARKIILNQAAVRLLLPRDNAVGQLIFDQQNQAYEVIAVVGDTKYDSIRKSTPPTVYPIMALTPGEKFSYSAIVRLKDPELGHDPAFAAAVRNLSTSMASDMPLPVITTMNSELQRSLRSERMMAMFSVFFAACALMVTAIGLYGTVAYATSRRTSEIGIRMALGAQRCQVVLLVFRENAWSAAIGTQIGFFIALGASRVLASFLYETSHRDLKILLASAGLLLSVASAASLIPAIRAARVDPLKALRAE
jgi:predicted permease